MTEMTEHSTILNNSLLSMNIQLIFENVVRAAPPREIENATIRIK